jgi:hypothetical protein
LHSWRSLNVLKGESLVVVNDFTAHFQKHVSK